MDDTPNLGLVFPGTLGGEQLVSIPLTLPMGYKKLAASLLHHNRNHFRCVKYLILSQNRRPTTHS